VQYLLIFRVLLFVFGGAVYLVLYGIESVLLVSTIIILSSYYGIESVLLILTIVIPSSHNITTFLCCYRVGRFIPAVIIPRYDCNPTLNKVVKKLFVVGICKP
jgi:hypothetical protein